MCFVVVSQAEKLCLFVSLPGGWEQAPFSSPFFFGDLAGPGLGEVNEALGLGTEFKRAPKKLSTPDKEDLNATLKKIKINAEKNP